MLFDEKGKLCDDLVKFVDDAREEGSLLVHAQDDPSRACLFVLIYFMHKFQWTLGLALEFISSRRRNLQLRASFIQQLAVWDAKR